MRAHRERKQSGSEREEEKERRREKNRCVYRGREKEKFAVETGVQKRRCINAVRSPTDGYGPNSPPATHTRQRKTTW